MYIKPVLDVCTVRQQLEGRCNGCIYAGSKCEHVKKILKVNKPFEYNNILLKKGDAHHESISKEQSRVQGRSNKSKGDPGRSSCL